MEFGERLRVLRARRGLTQAEVASRAGVSRRSYVAYEQQGKRPRSRETYAQLADVLGCDVNDLLVEDHAAADAEASFARFAALGDVGGEPLGLATLTALAEAAPVSSARETLQRLAKEHKSFAATARGLIYSALAERGVRFAPNPSAESYAGTGPEEVISLENDQFDCWWLVFEADGRNSKEGEEAHVLDLCASMLMSGFYEYAPDPRRKASVVVGDEGLFAALLRKRGRNSYRGNLSAILVDRDDVSLASEAYLTTYDEDADATEMLRVAEEPAGE